ncbi:3-oxoacyl-[acyl-carrier protein] reductase [hydrothermal vent metagenome]|uniref:3-oxoacyl-[acyl-carrier protein] reductase n=1 Tax=hydrothermal vent metagenome TaxID=652676 RepID=A0A3B1CAB3_9ZZZZ
MDRLKGKTAIVTGAAKGIGQGIAEGFAGEGADLLLVTLNSSLAETVAACEAKGAKVEEVAGDVGDPDFAKTVISKAKETFGKIDILVNNAGITRDGLLLRMKDDDFDEVVRVNLKGAFNFIRAVSRIMIKQRTGKIINISSVVGQTGNPGQANYAASKAGLFGLTKSAARELASRGITVNAIAPGYIETTMTRVLPDEAKKRLIEEIPLGRIGCVDDVAKGAIYLASEEAGYVTGQTLSINGGMLM